MYVYQRYEVSLTMSQHSSSGFSRRMCLSLLLTASTHSPTPTPSVVSQSAVGTHMVGTTLGLGGSPLTQAVLNIDRDDLCQTGGLA